VSRWIASIRRPMSSVARAVSLASSFTSFATTAKPLPASPARAASMVAFKARRFVCCAMAVIILITLPISADDAPRRDTVSSVVLASATPREATLAASWAFLAISRMLAPISSTPALMVLMFMLTCSAAAATTPAWDAALSVPSSINLCDAPSSSDEAVNVAALSPRRRLTRPMSMYTRPAERSVVTARARATPSSMSRLARRAAPMGVLTSSTPRTSPTSQPLRGVSGWVLWHCTQALECSLSAMATRTVSSPLEVVTWMNGFDESACTAARASSAKASSCLRSRCGNGCRL